MESNVMNIEVFPLFIREKIHTPMVSVQEQDGNIILVPIKEETTQLKKPRYGLGCMKGRIQEAVDHDWFEPLEDFKEYM
jgi:hypothetical protein